MELRPIVIRRANGWSALQLNDIWEYRDLLYFLFWRDLKARYRQTALGPLWIILQPLMSMVLYSFIFGQVARLPSEDKPYAVFSYVALLPWGFFADAFNSGVNGLLSEISLTSKVYFPRLLVPLARIFANLLDLSFSFIVLLGMMAVFGLWPSWGVVVVPGLVVLAAATGLGCGLLFSGAIVRYRDIGQITGFIVRMWMYLTPVVYSIDIVPESWRVLYRLNPMTGVVEGFRWAFLDSTRSPDWILLGISAVCAVLVLYVGLIIFKRAERDIVDVA